MPSTLDATPGPAELSLSRWLRSVRTSSRLAFLLHLIMRALTSLMALTWAPLLLDAMGESLNGLYLTFQSVTQLGGLGDLGMGGAVAIKAGQCLGRKEWEPLEKFLASARTVFLVLGAAVGGGFLLLSPWLPHWLNFKTDAGAGSLSLLCAVGSVSVGMVVLASYVKNLNYAGGTVLWPIIPSFVLLQGCLCAHWLLARQHRPLWIQYIPYSTAALIDFALACFYLRAAFPRLAKLLPLKFDRQTAATLFESSFWMYLISLGYVVYTATDRLIIQAFFGPKPVNMFYYNYRACELAMMLIFTAGFVSLPKITQWLAAPDEEGRARARAGLERLNQFQTVLGCLAALAYLAFNDLFMTLWLGPHMRAPLPWQAAFALNLAINTGRDAGFQAATRSGEKGIRFAGLLVAATALLNLCLSILAAKLGYILGIALAASVVQTILGLGTGLYFCRHLKQAWLPWAFKSWLVPVLAVGLAAAGRLLLPFDSTGNILLLAVLYAILAVLVVWLLGVRVALLKEELNTVRSFLNRRAQPPAA